MQYNPYGFEPLLQTLMALSDATATTPQTEIIMAYKQRYPIEQKFFRAAAKLFHIREVSPPKLNVTNSFFHERLRQASFRRSTKQVGFTSTTSPKCNNLPHKNRTTTTLLRPK